MGSDAVAAGVSHPVAEPTRPVELPAFGAAARGTPLAGLDGAHAERQGKLKAARAARRKALVAAGTAMLRAINRGKLDPRSIKPDPPRWPEPAPVPAEEPEDRGSLAWLKWHTAQNPQPPEEYAAEVAAHNRAQFAELTSGKVQPSSVRRIDYDPGSGVYTSRTRRRGGPWSGLRVIAVGRPEPRTAVAVLRPLRADRARRETPARTASRGGDSGDSSDSSDESDGDSDPPGVARAFALPRGGALRHVSVAASGSFDGGTPSELYTPVPGLGPFAEHRRRYGHLSPSGQLAAFLTLPEWQRQQAWRSLRFDMDRERGPPAVTSVRP